MIKKSSSTRALENLDTLLRNAITLSYEKATMFFKTKKGEYGEGDVFLGVTTPAIRKIAKNFHFLSLEEIYNLLSSKVHEKRLLAVIILVQQYKASPKEFQREIYEFYLENKTHINNWDIIDISCHHIVGSHLLDKDKTPLFKLANSNILWDRRIAIISTWHFIKNDDLDTTLEIAKLLLDDSRDLIHKACGWMLREVGKKDNQRLHEFIKSFGIKMPRTMLRYSIEKFPEAVRRNYLLSTKS